MSSPSRIATLKDRIASSFRPFGATPHSSSRATADVLALVRRFLPYLGRVRWQAAQVVGLAVLSPLIAAALLWLAKLLIDEIFIGGRMDLLPTIVVAYVAALAAKITLGYLDALLDAAVVEQISQDVRTDLFRHLVSVSPGSLGKRGVGDLLTHLGGDVRHVEKLIFTGLLTVFADAIGALFFFCFLLFLSWKLTLCALLIVPLLVLVSVRIAPRIRRAARISRHAETDWMTRAEERLGAAPIIHAFGAEAVEAGGFEARCGRARQAEVRTAKAQAWMAVLIEVLASIGGLAVICLGAYEIHSGRLTVGTFVAFLGSIGSLYGPARGLAQAAGRFQRAAAGARRVADLLDAPSLVTERPFAKPLSSVKGALEFQNVCFSYSPGGAQVLKDISLKIEPGEMVAVVGASGGGKSTLVRLALRLYDPTMGTVLIDGVDLRDMTLESVRRATAVVFQEPYIFHGSISENIRYGGREARDDHVKAMASAAHVDGFAEALPLGYGSPVGPRGGWISGGQRQRLALARALLREAPILLLDEATASVDSETEELIQDAVERLAGYRTLLVVGHRLSSVRRADRVVVIDQGRIVESGSPASLLKAGTRYHDLFAAQLSTGRL